MEELTFGKYMGEPIQWLVLGDGLLISKYCIEAMAYHDEIVPITWADCSLRKWLNGEFFSGAFSDEEKEKILVVKNENEDNQRFGTLGGAATEDKVFILSASEAEKYFSCNEERMAPPTEHARENGIYMSWDHPWWWLRTPGNYPNIACEVYYDGYIDYLGHTVNFKNDGVRPVIKIKNWKF